MTEKHRIISVSFENMTPQDERFLRHKFHLNHGDIIDARLEQKITTSMRVDLFYQTAECSIIPVKDLPWSLRHWRRLCLQLGGRQEMAVPFLHASHLCRLQPQ
jgi:hypothetical protein